MISEEKPQGILFDTIAFYNNNQFEQIVENISFEQSFFYITVALQHAYKSGVFTMEESEIVSKSLRTFNNSKEQDGPKN